RIRFASVPTNQFRSSTCSALPSLARRLPARASATGSWGDPLQLYRLAEFARTPIERVDRREYQFLDAHRTIRLDVEDERVRHVLHIEFLVGIASREVVVELFSRDQFAVVFDDPPQDVRLLVGELFAVAEHLDGLEVAVADRDATLMFGVLSTGVEHRLGFDFETLTLFEFDDRNVLFGGFDHRVHALHVARIGGVGTRNVECERDALTDFELLGRRGKGNHPESVAD